MRVLLIGDNIKSPPTLRQELAAEGFAVERVRAPDDAVGAARANEFDAIVVDSHRPDDDHGIAICAALRSRRIGTPVIMLMPIDNAGARIRSLETGADDTLTKPFATGELVARLRALNRRHIADRRAILRAGALSLDTSSRTAAVGRRRLDLTPRELSILEYFMHHVGRLLTRAQIEQHVWTWDTMPTSNLVEVYVGRIRRKLGRAGTADPFVTVRGEGYRLERDALSDLADDQLASA